MSVASKEQSGKAVPGNVVLSTVLQVYIVSACKKLHRYGMSYVGEVDRGKTACSKEYVEEG